MLLSDYQAQRDQRLASIDDNGRGDKERFWRSIKNSSNCNCADISAFIKELEGVDFVHPGLTSAQYMSHCYRVATMTLNHHHAPSLSMLKLCLCHNIFEIAGQSEKIVSLIGPDLANKVSILTVNRSRQWDKDYKKSYYKQVSRLTLTATVKVYDKLDNIYLLSDNPDQMTKTKYLAEINQFVLPLAEKYAPKVSKVFFELYKKNLTLLNSNRE